MQIHGENTTGAIKYPTEAASASETKKSGTIQITEGNAGPSTDTAEISGNTTPVAEETDAPSREEQQAMEVKQRKLQAEIYQLNLQLKTCKEYEAPEIIGKIVQAEAEMIKLGNDDYQIINLNANICEALATNKTPEKFDTLDAKQKQVYKKTLNALKELQKNNPNLITDEMITFMIKKFNGDFNSYPAKYKNAIENSILLSIDESGVAALILRDTLPSSSRVNAVNNAKRQALRGIHQDTASVYGIDVEKLAKKYGY